MKETPPDPDLPRKVAFGLAGTFAVACTLGTNVFGAHTPFLFGAGGLSSDITSSFSWVSFNMYIFHKTVKCMNKSYVLYFQKQSIIIAYVYI